MTIIVKQIPNIVDKNLWWKENKLKPVKELHMFLERVSD